MTTFCYNPKTDQFYERSGRLLSDFVHQEKAASLGALAFFHYFPKEIETEIRLYLRGIEVISANS